MKSIANPAVNASMMMFTLKANLLAERLGTAVAAKYLETRGVPLDMAWLILRPFMGLKVEVKLPPVLK